MSEQPTSLDLDTCEAIAKHIDKIRREAADDGATITEGYAKWALRIIREVTPEPEPPATPTAGAVRAASIITYMGLIDQLENKNLSQLATIIDEKTGLPELVVANAQMLAALERVDAESKDNSADKWQQVSDAISAGRSIRDGQQV